LSAKEEGEFNNGWIIEEKNREEGIILGEEGGMGKEVRTERDRHDFACTP
jgi:hypothetical protein